MEALQERVALLFPLARGRRTRRIGIEHELLTADVSTGEAVPVERVRRATAGAAYAPWVAFEPGGQLELSLPCADSADEAVRRLRATIAAVRSDCAREGIAVAAVPVDPREEEDVPLQLTTPRYVAMQTHFDRIGPAGRRMMRRTASTQVCLDWWPGRAGVEQWHLLLLAGPFLAAAFARSTGPGSRLATWLEVDPSRTAFDGRLLRGDAHSGAYADFAARARVFTAPGDPDQHLTTLFPPVRPRGGYLEVRCFDVQDEGSIGRLLTVLTTLVHDDRCRRAALRMLAGERNRLGTHWKASAAGHPDTRARGEELVVLAERAAGGSAGGTAAAAATAADPCTEALLGGVA